MYFFLVFGSGGRIRVVSIGHVGHLLDFTNGVRGNGLANGGGTAINTQVLRGHIADSRSVWIAAVAIPLMLLAPALWNGYPLLQWDTGGYLARWYEGYLVPSRSTVFGIYLHFGEDSAFWINLGIQALANAVDPATNAARARPCPAAAAIGDQPSAGRNHGAALACQHAFDGHFYRPVGAVALHLRRAWQQDVENRKVPAVHLYSLRGGYAQRHLGVLFGLCSIGWIARPFLRGRITIPGLAQGSLTIVAGAAMLLSANFAVSGQVAWTPGGYGVAFGRMLQDGIVARYLREHCPQQMLKLCPYRDQLPATADQFLWGNSMFNTLGRFKGLNDEMASSCCIRSSNTRQSRLTLHWPLPRNN